jgi:hypothetical protein
MKFSTMTSERLDLEGMPVLLTHSEEHRGWMVSVDVKRVEERYYAEIFVRSPGNLGGMCIPHGGVYATEGAARNAGLGIGCRWVDCHGIGSRSARDGEVVE